MCNILDFQHLRYSWLGISLVMLFIVGRITCNLIIAYYSRFNLFLLILYLNAIFLQGIYITSLNQSIYIENVQIQTCIKICNGRFTTNIGPCVFDCFLLYLCKLLDHCEVQWADTQNNQSQR